MMTPTQRKAMEMTLHAMEEAGRQRGSTANEYNAIIVLRAALAEQPAEQEPVKFLANGTRFKMSFFHNEDGEGNTVPGTHVTCFEGFEEELDGRWVALITAEDDCHLKYTAPQPTKQPLTGKQVTEGCRSLGVGAYQTLAAAFKAGVRYAEAAHGIGETK